MGKPDDVRERLIFAKYPSRAYKYSEVKPNKALYAKTLSLNMSIGSDNDRPLHLRLEVVAFHDQPPEEQNVCIFSEHGGSIGRSDDNDYVLPDTESVISRTHAQIAYENARYYLIDLSTNGTFVNDSQDRLEPGRQYLINDGDRILIGNYLLVASLIAVDSPLDRTSSLFEEKPLSRLKPDMVSEEPAGSVDEYGKLPDMGDWPSDAKRPSWFPTGEEIDEEAGGKVPSDAELREERPPVPALQQHLAQPVSDQSREAAPGEAGPGSEQPRRRVSGTGVPTGYIPGGAQFDDLVGVDLVPGDDSDKGDPFASTIGGEAELGDGSPSEERPREDEAGSDAADSAQPSEPAPITTPSGIRGPFEQPVAEDRGRGIASPAGPQTDSDLLAALIKGLGSPALRIAPEKGPEFATQVGKLVQEAVRGMIDTLRLRDEFKREFYVPVTRIAPTDNNVFKHSANVDDAMARAFTEVAGTAYMDPVESTRQAFQDIAAHQLALVAGMQAAVAFVLERFSPQALEERIGKGSMLDGVLPQIRKAHMWEQFEKEYAKIAEQAEEDFQRVFGQHFERAYTQQIRQLQSAGFGGHKDSDS